MQLDSLSDTLKVLDFDEEGTPNWTEVSASPGGLNVLGFIGMGALTGTRIAAAWNGNGAIRIYDYAAGTWSIVGTPLIITSTLPTIATLTDSLFTFNDGASDTLASYLFNGSTIAIQGSAIAVADGNFHMAALTSTRLATVNRLASDGHGILQAYDRGATTWATVGNPLDIGIVSSVVAVAALTSTLIAVADGSSDTIRAYTFDGTDWTLVTDSTTAITGASSPALCPLSADTVAFNDAGIDEIRAYRLTSAGFVLVGAGLALSVTGPRLASLSRPGPPPA